MFGYLKDKATHFVITLRLGILIIFAILFMGTLITLLSIFYYHLDEVVHRATLLLMARASYSISQEIDSELRPPESLADLSVNLIKNKVVDVKANEEEVARYLEALLQKLPFSSGMQWGDVEGNFASVYREANGSLTTIMIDRRHTPTVTTIYRDPQGKEIKRTVSSNVSFDPRTREWFQMAINNKHIIWSYIIRYVGNLVVTVASPVFNDDGTPLGVFGIDTRLVYLSRYVAQQKIGKNGDIMILNQEGKLIAAPELVKYQATPSMTKKLINIHDVSKPWVATAFDLYAKNNKSIFRFKYNGVIYLAAFRPAPVLPHDRWLIGIVVPADDFSHSIHHVELSYILIFLSIFLFGVFAMSNLASRIVKPIKKLVEETRKIQNFNLEGTTQVPSHIKEVNELSNAIYRMKMGLRSFGKYVPAGLVRQLIATNEDARIGGAKRDVVIFFSDIINFTTITEKVNSNALTKQMTEYLEMFTKVIRKNEGTIDKFIGDSVMAFWGAPLAVEDPCQRAARATLTGMTLLAKLNAEWAKENKPKLLTRIGIHFGEAIVGNIGSSERLNYTAIGDTVNIASRLVSANKLYGTSILVTEAVFERIKDIFVLRMVDKVKLKGKVESTGIYELLAENKESLAFDIDTYTLTFDKAFKSYQAQHWQEAIAFFTECLNIYPDDVLAPLFIKRCEFFKLNPPSPKWDGVWQFIEK